MSVLSGDALELNVRGWPDWHLLSASTRAAFLGRNEVIVVVVATAEWVAFVPITTVTTFVSKKIWVVMFTGAWDRATTADTAHLISVEVVIVQITALKRLVCIVGAGVTTAVSESKGGVLTDHLVSTLASATHLSGVEVVSVELTAGLWVVVVPRAVITGGVSEVKVGVVTEWVAICGLSVSTTARAAHGVGEEIVIVKEST